MSDCLTICRYSNHTYVRHQPEQRTKLYMHVMLYDCCFVCCYLLQSSPNLLETIAQRLKIEIIIGIRLLLSCASSSSTSSSCDLSRLFFPYSLFKFERIMMSLLCFTNHFSLNVVGVARQPVVVVWFSRSFNMLGDIFFFSFCLSWMSNLMNVTY